MNLAAPPILRPDEYTETEPRLLSTLSMGFREIHQTLAQVPARAIKAGAFTSAASGVTTVDVKSPLGKKPQHVNLTLRRDDLADFSAAWSWWWVLTKDFITLKFIGLPATVKHIYSIEVL